MQRTLIKFVAKNYGSKNSMAYEPSCCEPESAQLSRPVLRVSAIDWRFPGIRGQVDSCRTCIPTLAYSYGKISEFLHRNIGLSGTITYSCSKVRAKQLETEMEQLSQKINADGLTGILNQCDPNNALQRELWTGSKVT